MNWNYNRAFRPFVSLIAFGWVTVFACISALMFRYYIMRRCLEGALHEIVLEHQRNGYEHKVQQEHGETKGFVHFPVESSDRQHNEDQHHEEYGNRAHHADGVYCHRFAVDKAVQQPRYRQSVEIK